MEGGDIKWFHSIDLGDRVTPGLKPLRILQLEAESYFRVDIPVRGKSVLDIGAWDGFMSFEAERRGAACVVASDHFCWDGPGWGTKDGFDHAKRALNSNVGELWADVFDLDPAKHGKFDIVLMPGVIYHLTDPWGGLKKAANMCNEVLIVESATAMNTCTEPVMRYWVGNELNNDPTNFWTPNDACLRGMLTDIGFNRIETAIYSRGTPRIVAHAWR